MVQLYIYLPTSEADEYNNMINGIQIFEQQARADLAGVRVRPK